MDDAGQSGSQAERPVAAARQRSARSRRRRRIIRAGAGVASLLVLALVAYVAFQYESLSTGIKRSDALTAVRATGGGGVRTPSLHGDTNILVMGLDSRLDENGNPLPKALYKALHTGDQSIGGFNANVLMLLHVPGNGGRATEISIPRDDYVSLAGCPDGQCHGKIKEAYGLAYDAAAKRLAHNSGASKDRVQQQQLARDAGRQAEIATVEQFLGGVPIDHFVEVTMVAFYEIAQVVQPITICVNEDTQDSYSGANFRKGRQQIDAAQAVAFVRQRRDTHNPSLNFTDLDRDRRQQAFIASLAHQLKQAGTFTDPAKLSQILDVAKANIAVDSGLNLLSLAEDAANLSGGNITYYTLPVDHFGKEPLGEDVNIVNLPLIRSTVRRLIGSPSGSSGSQGGGGAGPSATPSPSPASPSPPSAAPVTALPATGAGTKAPPPSALTALSGGGIPCVK